VRVRGCSLLLAASTHRLRRWADPSSGSKLSCSRAVARASLPYSLSSHWTRSAADAPARSYSSFRTARCTSCSRSPALPCSTTLPAAPATPSPSCRSTSARTEARWRRLGARATLQRAGEPAGGGERGQQGALLRDARGRDAPESSSRSREKEVQGAEARVSTLWRRGGSESRREKVRTVELLSPCCASGRMPPGAGSLSSCASRQREIRVSDLGQR